MFLSNMKNPNSVSLKNAQIALRVAGELREKLTEAAHEDGRSLSSMVNKILADWAARRRPPKQIERKRGLR
jgi:hypothetical protein